MKQTQLLQPLGTMVRCFRCEAELRLTAVRFMLGRPGGWCCPTCLDARCPAPARKTVVTSG